MRLTPETLLVRLGGISFLLLVLCAPAPATIRYTISLQDREQHLARVEMRVPAVAQELTVQLPAWNALYQIRDFAQHVRELRAVDSAGQPLDTWKLDKQTWTIRTAQGRTEIRIQYVAEWNEPGAFGAEISSQHAFLNLAMLLLYVPNRRSEAVSLEFTDLPSGWRAAAALETGTRPNELRAASYDALVDAPVEIGEFEEFRFEADGPAGKAKIRVVAHSGSPIEPEARAQLTETLQRIVAYQTGMMREVPFQEFTFIYHFGSAAGGGGGGMEHMNSTAIHGGSPLTVMGVSAHEFFHLWNVKRIRPKSLEPVDYTRENWTRSLWFAEGVTSTYTSFTLVRSGLWTPQQFYNDLGGQITSLQRRPARLWKSVEEASLDAWLEKYTGYLRPEYSISYYNKGQLLGVLLDILIRDATDNRKSLDDVLRDLNTKFARRGLFYDERVDLLASVERVSGKRFEDFFRRYVSGTAELPCAEILALAGMKLEIQGAVFADLGFRVERAVSDNRVTQVQRGGDAERVGVREGDVLVGVNGQQPPANLLRWLRQQKPGDTVRLTLRRGGAVRDVEVRLGEQISQSWSVDADPAAGEKARRIREAMLSGRTD